MAVERKDSFPRLNKAFQIDSLPFFTVLCLAEKPECK